MSQRSDVRDSGRHRPARVDDLPEEFKTDEKLREAIARLDAEGEPISLAEEIVADTGGKLDYFLSGVGTAGTITGVGEVLKAKIPGVKVVAIEPEDSPVISGGQPGPHPIQGIGAGFIPANLHTQAIDGAIQVEPEDAKEMARRCAREEGLLVGISSGATLAAIRQKLAELPAGARVNRVNWSTRHNGNCVEVVFTDGELAGKLGRFLHLSSIDGAVTPRAQLVAGAQIGAVGSTGRSSAPHLHYEVRERDGRVLSPLVIHGTLDEMLPAEECDTFNTDVALYDRMLDGAAITN